MPVGIFILFFHFTATGQEVITTREPVRKHSLGAGIGIPYGIFGLNLSMNVLYNLDVSAGIGTTYYAGVGYSLGFKYFFTRPEEIFRPRVSAFYGTNNVLYFKDNKDENRSYSGLNIALGAQLIWPATRNGFDFDVFYKATSRLNVNELRNQGLDVKKPKNVGISLGFRRAF